MSFVSFIPPSGNVVIKRRSIDVALKKIPFPASQSYNQPQHQAHNYSDEEEDIENEDTKKYLTLGRLE